MANFWEKLPKPFLALAPMEDVTDVVFRKIVAGCAKPDVFVTEFTSADGLCSKGREKIIHRFNYTESQRPIVAQIWGKNPENLYQAAKIVKSLKFDGIDINMGCPDKTVMKQGCGAGLIGNYGLAEEIIDCVKSAAKGLPVSVKTRLGKDSFVTKPWIEFLAKQNLAAITIHGRTAAQLSTAPASWSKIGKAVAIKNKISPKTLLIGNGDIASYKQALAVHKKYGVDGIMIGRGVFANPWVFEKSLKPALHGKDDYIELLLKHLKLFEKTWGKTKNYQIMKKFFKMYIHNFDGANLLRQQLMVTTNSRQAQNILSNI